MEPSILISLLQVGYTVSEVQVGPKGAGEMLVREEERGRVTREEDLYSPSFSCPFYEVAVGWSLVLVPALGLTLYPIPCWAWCPLSLWAQALP